MMKCIVPVTVFRGFQFCSRDQVEILATFYYDGMALLGVFYYSALLSHNDSFLKTNVVTHSIGTLLPWCSDLLLRSYIIESFGSVVSYFIK